MQRTHSITIIETPMPGKGRLSVAVGTFIILMFGAGPAASYLHLTGNAKLPLLIPGLLASIWMGHEAIRYSRVSGCATPANLRYNKRMIPLALVYVVALIVAVNAQRLWHSTGILALAIAILPALLLVVFVWAMGRLLIEEEEDEYQRMLHAKRALVATGFMLAVSTVWGFLESSDLVPHAPAYFGCILWCIGLGMSRFTPWERS